MTQTAWTHVTFGIDAGYLRYVYANGTVRTSNANLLMGTRLNTNTILRVGCLINNDSFTDNFKGYLDDLVLWNTFVPQSTAATFHQTTDFMPHAPSAWYRFDGNGNDASGNGRHLTVVNTVYYE